jgi:hypothetical protein
VTSSKDRQIEAYSIGLTILERLGCPETEEEEKNKLYFLK